MVIFGGWVMGWFLGSSWHSSMFYIFLIMGWCSMNLFFHEATGDLQICLFPLLILHLSVQAPASLTGAHTTASWLASQSPLPVSPWFIHHPAAWAISLKHSDPVILWLKTLQWPPICRNEKIQAHSKCVRVFLHIPFAVPASPASPISAHLLQRCYFL